jgi:4-hydroxy-tetrahydrodipicolinate synthase
VFEQQPGVAIRKDLLRRRGLFASARVRHPAATISPAQSAHLAALVERTLPGVDITRPVAIEQMLST